MLSGSCLESDTKWTHYKWVSAVNLGLLHCVALWRRVCCYISIIWPSHKSNDHCSTAPLLLPLQRHHIRAGFGFHFPVINFNNTIIMIIYERMYSFAVSAWVCVDMCLCRIDWLVLRTKYWDLCCMQNPSKPHMSSKNFIGIHIKHPASPFISTPMRGRRWINILLYIISRSRWFWWFSALLPLLCPRWPVGAAVERGVRSGHQGRSVTCHVWHSLLIRDGGTGLENWEETSDPCTVNQGPAFYQPILYC